MTNNNFKILKDEQNKPIVLELLMFDNRWYFVDLYDTGLKIMAKFFSPTTKCFLNIEQEKLIKYEQEQILKVKNYDKI